METPPRPGGFQAPRVLVVDDNELVRLLVSTVLGREGYEVVAVAAATPRSRRQRPIWTWSCSTSRCPG